MIKFNDGEVTFVIRGHEDGCPAAFSSDIGECTCKVLRFVETKDTTYVQRVMNNHRAMCRKARREAERAMRKASKTKAARATGAASKGTSNAGGDCNTRKNGGAA